MTPDPANLRRQVFSVGIQPLQSFVVVQTRKLSDGQRPWSNERIPLQLVGDFTQRLTGKSSKDVIHEKSLLEWPKAIDAKRSVVMAFQPQTAADYFRT
jgi:hypothetical protein